MPADRSMPDGERSPALFLELARSVSSSLDLQDVLDQTFAALRKLVPFNGGAIQLIEDEHLVAAATVPAMTEEARSVRIPVGQGISGSIAATGEQIYIPDITRDERVPEEARRRGVSGGVRSYFGVPLIARGEPIGVLQVDSLEVDAFTLAMRSDVIAFLPTVSSAVANAQLFDRERETLEQLQHADLVKRNFMSVVSHELRTPLAVVLGFSETLARKVDDFDPDQVADIASRTYNAATRLERLINDLIQVSQAERRRLHIDLRGTDVEHVLEQVSFETSEAEHQIVLEIEKGLPPIWTDPDRAVQILDNLITNARKFSPAGTEISMTARRADDRVIVTVTDQGHGIAEDMQEKIFEPFFQIDQTATRRAGGLGIGLYLARELCERMDATIEVESEPGSGSTFVVTFPLEGESREEEQVRLFEQE
jgi:signal transduction histidine kinase